MAQLHEETVIVKITLSKLLKKGEEPTTITTEEHLVGLGAVVEEVFNIPGVVAEVEVDAESL